MKNSNKLILSAAVAGIIAGGVLAPTFALAGDKGQCVGANACKGKGACKSDANECKGKNGCKGKGFTETTKAKCDKLAKNNPDVKFQEPEEKN
ncbi:MAG TPA: hypothetical protein VNX68_18285 [Nitrosopumilaceae archaeon]|nr:hypothetical protein [Nitrosopumilaceae archaeon]